MMTARGMTIRHKSYDMYYGDLSVELKHLLQDL